MSWCTRGNLAMVDLCRTLGNRLVEHCAGTLLLPDISDFRRGHSADNISVMCIDKPPKSDTTMKKKKKQKQKHLEKDWIITLQTSQPSGININD